MNSLNIVNVTKKCVHCKQIRLWLTVVRVYKLYLLTYLLTFTVIFFGFWQDYIVRTVSLTILAHVSQAFSCTSDNLHLPSQYVLGQ